MAIEVPITREITEYEAKYAFGLSLRQIISTAVALIVGIPAFLLIRKSTDSNTASTIVMFIVSPIFFVGFVKIKGYTVEKYLGIVWRHRVAPQKRYYKTQNRLLWQDGEPTEKDLDFTGTGKRAKNECMYTVKPLTKKEKKKNIQFAKKEIKAAKKEMKASIKAHKKAEKAALKKQRKEGKS